MSQYGDKSQNQSLPSPQGASRTSSTQDNNSLTNKASKLNLTVQINSKKTTESSKASIQLKTNAQAGAEPGQITDADVLNTITHLVKSATVHPLGSSSANRELRVQRSNLEQNKEMRNKAVDQTNKNQLIVEQAKIQQRAAGEQVNNRDGAQLASRESKAGSNTKNETIINKGVADKQNSTDVNLNSPIKEVQKFKEEHSKSQSANNANASGLSQRNTSKEGQLETLTADLTRQRSEDNKQKELKSENKVTLPETIPLADSKLSAEIKVSELRIADVQTQIIQTAIVAQKTAAAATSSEVEEEIHDSWLSRTERKKIFHKKKQLAKAAKRTERKLTPLERRKQLLRRDRNKKIRKLSRRKNRKLISR